MRHLVVLLTVAFAATVAVAGSPSPVAAATPFTDISNSKFRSDIDWAYNTGITVGCSPTRFCPKGLVTRAQMATFLARMFELPATNRDYFGDDDDSRHEWAINRIAAAGITVGCGSNRFCPDGVVARDQMASFIARAAALVTGAGRNYFWDDDGNKHERNIDRIAAAGITTGCGDRRYCPSGAVTREQMVAFLHRVVAPRTPPPYGAESPTSFNRRPYTSSSAWNTPIRTSPTVDPHSASMVGTITGPLTSDPTQYSYPVYVATSTTPRYDVTCRVYRCTVVTETGTYTTSKLTGVPIPTGARPSEGSDASLIIIDPRTGTEWDFWQASFDGSTWSVSNASVYNVNWDGMPSRYGSRGAGVPYLAGLIRPWELAAGRIDHALAFAYPSPAAERCVWPASKTDGKSSAAYALPEGARLQLHPRFTEADFDRWGLDRSGKIIARALQKYGMFVVDNSGRPKLFAEDVSVNPRAGFSYSDPSTKLTAATVSSIPISGFRVLALPSGYWSESSSAPMHGRCYR